MVLEFFQAIETGERAVESAITRAIPSVFGTAFQMIASGDTNQIIAGLLTLLGITLLVLGGLWKMVAKVLWRS